MKPPRRQRVIFCDFDGTITMNDNIVAVLEHFEPERGSELVQQVLDKTISIREGIGHMFALFSPAKVTDILTYLRTHAQIRPGFRELLDYCQNEQIAFYVTSGGVEFLIHAILEPFGIAADHIFCNQSDFSGPSIRITWPHPCEAPCQNDCGMCKVTIIRRFESAQYERILIGDSITDFEGAKLVDHVFARSHLIDECEALGITYVPYDDFYTIIEQLKELYPHDE